MIAVQCGNGRLVERPTNESLRGNPISTPAAIATTIALGFFHGVTTVVSELSESIEDYSESRIITDGDYATEDDAKSAFLSAFSATNCFNIYKEVPCWYFGGSVFGDKPTGRIDYVLTPRQSLISKGWGNGCVGVEVKKSGHKAGPVICQMIDYSKAIFRLPLSCGMSLICLTSVCSFPGFAAHGAVQSVMANNRCGVASITKRGCQLTMGAAHFFSFSEGEVYVLDVTCGYKNGSR